MFRFSYTLLPFRFAVGSGRGSLVSSLPLLHCIFHHLNSEYLGEFLEILVDFKKTPNSQILGFINSSAAGHLRLIRLSKGMM
jgi:hypothetical protein